MAAKKWKSTKSRGIRFYEHETRKHGVKKDRYYAIRYTVDGRQVEEGLGWSSQGWNEAKAVGLRAELAENRRRGEGPRTLAEKRALEGEARQEKDVQKEKKAKDLITFKELAEGDYMAHSKATKKNERSWMREEGLLKLWINPVIGNKPLKEVAPIHLEKIKAKMVKANRAPRTIRYALAVISQVFNFAIRHGLFDGANPIKKVKLPTSDNRRLRFLTREEADALLDKLVTVSPEVHDMALLSLYTGMRAGEVFSLTWHDVDVERGILTLRDTKSVKTRAAFMTEPVKAIFTARERGKPSELIFKGRNGKIVAISGTFARAVDALKLNEGIEDRRQKVVFHSLRHTFASWLVENGTDLYTVKELLGHSDFAMTARYSHLGENTLQAAVKRLDKTFTEAPNKVVPLARKE